MSPRPSLGSTGERPSLRPDLRLRRPALEGTVNDGRRPPPQAARSVIDGPQSAGQTRKLGSPKPQLLIRPHYVRAPSPAKGGRRGERAVASITAARPISSHAC